MLATLLLISTALCLAEPARADAPWQRHTIDDTAKGADGVRLADANGDGLLDIATGWEEAGLVRVYLNPGPAQAQQPWPLVTVGQVKSPEDAVLLDADGDGAVDVITCCEGKTRSVFVHWAPREKDKYLDAAAWQTEAFPALRNHMAAMYCLPLQVDGERGVDLVIGGKNQAEIGWLQAPTDPRDVAAWKWHPLANAGWIMSLVAADIDGDGDPDVLASDRKGPAPGCLWLENPGPGPDQFLPWKKHAVGASGRDVMFLHQADWDGDARADILVPVHSRELFLLRSTAAATPTWDSQTLAWPANIGLGKGVRVADIDLDGRRDLVLTTENFERTSGVVWLSSATGGAAWTRHEVSGFAGPRGQKLDDLQTIDLDADGDLDILSTEERTGWGVTWWENPRR